MDRRGRRAPPREQSRVGGGNGEAPAAAAVLVPLASGVVAGGTLAWDPGVGAVVAATLMAVGTWLVAGARVARRAVRVGALASAAGLALGLASFALHARAPAPEDVLHRVGGPLTAVTGTVAAAEPRGDGVRLVVEAEHVQSAVHRGPATGRLAVTVAHARAEWPAGTRVRVVGRLRRPASFGNPGEFDVARALARRGIGATAFVWDDTGLDRLAGPAAPLAAALADVRVAVRARIARVADGAVGGYLRAVLLGDGGAVDPATRATLARTGLAHVTSVSGFHVAAVAAAGTLLARLAFGRSVWLLLHGDAAKLATLAGLPLVAAYALVAGGSVPALRSVLMYVAFVLAGLLGRPGDGIRGLAAAALVLAAGVPDLGADVSFQLSFAAVLGLLLRRVSPAVALDAGWRARAGRLVREALAVSWAASVATAPLTAWHFQQVSLVAPLANLGALPFLGPACLLPGLAAMPLARVAPGASEALLALAAGAAVVGLRVADALAAVPGAALATPMPNVFELALAFAIVAGAWWLGRVVPTASGAGPRATTRRWRTLSRRARRSAAAVAAGVALLVAGDVGYWLWQRFGTRDLRVTFLAVGQGDAAVAELPGGRLLVIDGGGFPGDFDPGERVLAPFLRARKIMRVDVLVLSHPQLDHYGGLAYLAEHFQPRELWWNGTRAASPRFVRLEETVARAGVRARVVRPHDAPERLGTVVVEVLHPDEVAAWGVNDGSIVLRFVYGRASILFTGDVERAAEAAIAAGARPVDAVVLKVPHHGSRTSTSPDLLAAVRPRIAVVSAGAGNRFGFPAGEVRGRLRRAGVDVWETALDGAVEVVTDGRRLHVSAPRRGHGVRVLALDATSVPVATQRAQ